MTASIGQIVAQLLDVRNRLAATAVTAMRAKADAEQALSHYEQAAQGTEHPQMKQAIDDIEIAGAKAAKVANILEKVKGHLEHYLTTVAPGSVPNDPSDQALPAGEQLVSSAERRGRRADIAWRKQLQKADDLEAALKATEKGGKAVFNFFKQQPASPGGTTSSSTTMQPPPSQERLQVDHPITAAIMAAGAFAVAARSVWKHVRTRRRARNDDDQT